MANVGLRGILVTIVGAILGATAWCIVVILNGAVFVRPVDREDVILFSFLGPILGAVLALAVWTIAAITPQRHTRPVRGAIIGIVAAPVAGFVLVVIMMQQLSAAGVSNEGMGMLVLYVPFYTPWVGAVVGAVTGMIWKLSIDCKRK